MGVVKKILLIALVLFAIILIAGISTYKPFFEVKEIKVVDHKGYPCLKISFKTDSYPVVFKLLTPEGELIYSWAAEKPEEVVYLYLTPGNPYKNILGPKSYVVRAFYGDKELWKNEVSIKGTGADVKILDVKFRSNFTGLNVESVNLDVKNTGDVPLYLNVLEDKLYLDDNPIPFSMETAIIMPEESSRVRLTSIISYISSAELKTDHKLRFSIPNVAEASYTIKALEPELRIERVGLKPFLSEWDVDNITLIISNNANYPINVKWWIEITVNGMPVSPLLWAASDEVLNPGERKTVIYDLSFVVVPKPIEIKVLLGKSEASWSSGG